MMGGQTHKQFTYTCIQYCAPHLRLQEMKIHILFAVKLYIAWMQICKSTNSHLITRFADK